MRKTVLLFGTSIFFISAAADISAQTQNSKKWFTNAAEEAGLSDTSMQNGIWADINGDG